MNAEHLRIGRIQCQWDRCSATLVAAAYWFYGLERLAPRSCVSPSRFLAAIPLAALLVRQHCTSMITGCDAIGRLESRVRHPLAATGASRAQTPAARLYPSQLEANRMQHWRQAVMRLVKQLPIPGIRGLRESEFPEQPCAVRTRLQACAPRFPKVA